MKTILVVDDSPENIDVLIGILDAEYVVKAARDGETAMSLAFSGTVPDCILLDVMMPGLDGFEVCRRLKSDTRTENIPVIFVTASDEMSDESTGFNVGGVDYLTKPVSPPLVLARVRTHIALSDRNRRLEELVGQRTAQLMKTNEMLRGVMENSNSAICQLSHDGKIRFFNSRTSQLTGHMPDDLSKMTYDMLFDIDDNREIVDGFEEVVTQGKSSTHIEAFLLKKDQKNSLVSVSLSPYTIDGVIMGAVLMFEDITAHKSMEIQLIHSGRMSAIGEMATGIAHELNQPLNVIKMASQLIRRGIDDRSNTDEFIAERVGKILENVDRASGIINHLRSFGRKENETSSEIDIRVPIENSLSLVGDQLIRSLIQFDSDIENDIPPVKGDSNRLEQVFTNLLINARDALINSPGSMGHGKINIRSFFDKSDGMVTVVISDNGPGISPKHIDRIFEPFFTTKEIGKGTGLGLSISYGIIRSHKGTISVASDDNGTSFTVKIPFVKE